MEGGMERKKAGDLVTDMLSADVVKPSEKLKASLTKQSGPVTDSDRERITEMLKGLKKYNDLEENECDLKEDGSKLGTSVKSPLKQDKSPKRKSGGLLDFIDAEMLSSNPGPHCHSEVSPKPNKEIVIKPAATLNNKTNLKALSSAFQNLTCGTDSEETKSHLKETISNIKVTSGDGKEEVEEQSEDSGNENEGSGEKKKRNRRRRPRKKKQDQVQETVPTIEINDLQPILVYDINEDEDHYIEAEEIKASARKGAKQGSYSQLLNTMGKGNSSPKTKSPELNLKSPKSRKHEYRGAEMIHVATACDTDGKTKRDVIIAPTPIEEKHDKKSKEKKKKDKSNEREDNGSQMGSRRSSTDRKEFQKPEKGKAKAQRDNKGAGPSPKSQDVSVKSPKRAENMSMKREKNIHGAEQSNRQVVGLEEEECRLEQDYSTTATVNVRKQEHKYIIGHQGKHLQDIYIITGVTIEVPPININSDAIILNGLKSQLGPAVALMFSKSQQAQLEASQSKFQSQSKIARARELLLPQGRGQQGHQNAKGQQGNPGASQRGKKEQTRYQPPALVSRQHSSNSQSSTEYDLDSQEVIGRNVNQNANRGQYDGASGNRGHNDVSYSNRGQTTRPYGKMGQVNLKGPALYDQHYGNPNKQLHRGQGSRGQSQDQVQNWRNRDEQANQNPANKGQGKRQRCKKAMFADYISPEELSAGLKRGSLIQGPIRINPKNFEESYVPHPDGCSDIIICGLKDRNRALNGDIVAVELSEEGEWKLNKEELEHLAESHKSNTGEAGAENSESDSDDIVIESVETIEVVSSQSAGSKPADEQVKPVDNQSKKTCRRDSPMKRFVCLKDVMTGGNKTVQKMFGADRSSDAKKMLIRTGKVVAIVEKKHSRASTGYIKLFQDKLDRALFVPNDHRLPRIVIPIAECPEKFIERPEDFGKTLFVARIIDWKKDAPFADGHLAKSLGEAGEIEPETEGMLIENGIDFDEFPQEVLDCLPKQSPWCIPESEFEYRRDFRSSCVFTIDPKTARDLDDALSCEDLGDGRYKVGVHIADVSYFVKESTSLDVMAQLRATSVYLIQKVIPMLPRLLCEQLCSLNPDVERLTFSVEWIITEEGEIEEEWFGRSVIKSCVKLAYEHAQGFIEQPGKKWSRDELPPISAPYTVEDIKTRVLNFHKIAQNLRQARLDSGSLRLDQVKLQYSLDMDTMMPNGCFCYEQKDSNRLVEEFMLLANMAVAHRINKHFPDHAVLRRHPEPQQKMLENLKDQCSALGIHLDISSAGSLQRSIRNYYGNDEYSMARLQVLVSLCAKPMQNAKYFCTGCIDDEAMYHHYALNVPLYTHFTSPIRRYPDILVHRLLGASLDYCDAPSKAATQIHKTAEHCNDKKTAAKRVGDLSSELFFAVFIKTVGPLEEKGMVMAVFDKSFDVFMVRLGVSKRVYCDKLALKEKSFKKERKVPSLRLIWKEEEGHSEVEQEISIFSVVDCVLQQGELPLQWVVTIKRPSITGGFPAELSS